MSILANILGGTGVKAVGEIVRLFKIPPETVAANQIQLAEIAADTEKAQLDAITRELDASAQNIRSEATGGSWLQRNVRPLTMLGIWITILGNVWVAWFRDTAPIELDGYLYAAGMLGFMGYTAARSVEKIMMLRGGKK